MALIRVSRIRFATDESMATITNTPSSAFRTALEDLLSQIAAGIIANDPTIIAAAEQAVANAIAQQGILATSYDNTDDIKFVIFSQWGMRPDGDVYWDSAGVHWENVATVELRDPGNGYSDYLFTRTWQNPQI